MRRFAPLTLVNIMPIKLLAITYAPPKTQDSSRGETSMFKKLTNVMVASFFGLIALDAGGTAQASASLGVDFPTPPSLAVFSQPDPVNGSYFTVGWEFVANANTSVVGLGAFLGPDAFS